MTFRIGQVWLFGLPANSCRPDPVSFLVPCGVEIQRDLRFEGGFGSALLVVTAIDQNGTPVKDLHFGVFRDFEAFDCAQSAAYFAKATGVTDDEGRTIIRDLPEGRFRVIRTKGQGEEKNFLYIDPNECVSIEIPPGEASKEAVYRLAVHTPSSLQGTVSADLLLPGSLAWVRLEMEMEDGSVFKRSIPIEPDGTFALRGVPSGQAQVSLMVAGGKDQEATERSVVNVVLTAGRSSQVEFRME